MNELLYNAREELKRADHLIFVSLKYTRTVDVIKSVVERLISSFDFAIDALLEDAKEKHAIQDMPKTPGNKYNSIVKIYSDKLELIKFLDFYMVLRKISRAPYTRINEYRRHVTMIATIDSGVINLDIDETEVYFNRTIEFVDYITEFIEQSPI